MSQGEVMMPELVVGRWRLRALRVADAEAWFAIVQDPELRRLTSWNIDTIEVMQRSLENYANGPRVQSTRRWAIVDTDDLFCGTCGFKDWDREGRRAELTYELAASHRRRGTMSTIAAAVVDHGVEVMGLAEIGALVMVDNQASVRLLEKLGFRRTETLPAFRSCGGDRRDFYRYLFVPGVGSPDTAYARTRTRTRSRN